MKLEAVDIHNPIFMRVASIIDIKGNLLRLTYDGLPNVYDVWLLKDSTDIHPVGWCQRSNRTLLGPYGNSISKQNLYTDSQPQPPSQTERPHNGLKLKPAMMKNKIKKPKIKINENSNVIDSNKISLIKKRGRPRKDHSQLKANTALDLSQVKKQKALKKALVNGTIAVNDRPAKSKYFILPPSPQHSVEKLNVNEENVNKQTTNDQEQTVHNSLSKEINESVYQAKAININDPAFNPFSFKYDTQLVKRN